MGVCMWNVCMQVLWWQKYPKVWIALLYQDIPWYLGISRDRENPLLSFDSFNLLHCLWFSRNSFMKSAAVPDNTNPAALYRSKVINWTLPTNPAELKTNLIRSKHSQSYPPSDTRAGNVFVCFIANVFTPVETRSRWGVATSRLFEPGSISAGCWQIRSQIDMIDARCYVNRIIQNAGLPTIGIYPQWLVMGMLEKVTSVLRIPEYVAWP